ncbi:transposase [Atopobium sp. oral taxon 416]|nr:transposase [Atopobium sp. oral taxon 416]
MHWTKTRYWGCLPTGGGDAFRLLLQETLNGVLRAKSAEQLCAQPYERADSRNETKARPLTTRVATIELKVSRQRNAPFETLVFDNYKRKRGCPYDRDGRDGRRGRLYSEGGQGRRGGLRKVVLQALRL